MVKPTPKLEVDNFYCLSLEYNPILEATTPEIFEISNKGKKEKFTEEILANKLNGVFVELVMHWLYFCTM